MGFLPQLWTSQLLAGVTCTSTNLVGAQRSHATASRLAGLLKAGAWRLHLLYSCMQASRVNAVRSVMTGVGAAVWSAPPITSVLTTAERWQTELKH